MKNRHSARATGSVARIALNMASVVRRTVGPKPRSLPRAGIPTSVELRGVSDGGRDPSGEIDPIDREIGARDIGNKLHDLSS